jgi:hypothetical protein
VEARAAKLIAQEMTLRELRKARQLTQVRMARENEDGLFSLSPQKGIV